MRQRGSQEAAGELLGEEGQADPFVLRVMGPEDAAEVFALDEDVFLSQNVLFEFIKMTRKAWNIWEEYDTVGCIPSGLSLVIRDRTQDGLLVGFLLVNKHNLNREPGKARVERVIAEAPGWGTLAEVAVPTIIGAVRNPSYGHACWLTHRTCRIVAGGTRRGYEGRGLALRLRAKAVELASSKGYDRLIVETVSGATEHIYRDKLGFQVLASTPFKEYKRPDGSQPFKDLGEDLNFTVLQKVVRERPVVDSKVWSPFIMLGLVVRRACLGRLCQCICCCCQC